MPTVLIVSASPVDQDRLRLGAEEREIRQALQRSKNREQWRIETNPAATVNDLRRALLDHRPAIVHFAGHGDETGLCFETEGGDSHAPDIQPIARLFHIFRNDLKCVFLNACYSESQADAIRAEIDYVIGMRAPIGDDSARTFSVSFYDAVFAGTDFRTAFDLGCTTLDLNSFPDKDVPVFLTSPHLERTTLTYTAHVPEVERVLLAYLNTPFSDRWSHTTTGEPLLPTLRQHYGERMLEPVSRVRVRSMDRIEGESWRVAVDIRASRRTAASVFYFDIHERTVLLEWEASVGLWSVPPKSYLSLGSNEEVVARVTAELSPDYYGRFRENQTSWISLRLVSNDGDSLHGYVRRHAPLAEEMLPILSDGREHRLTLGLKNRTGDPSDSVVSSLLSRSWIYRPNEESTENSEGSTF